MSRRNAPVTSGYTECRCRDCFEIAVSDDMANPDFCWACEAAECDEDSECRVEPEGDDQ